MLINLMYKRYIIVFGLFKKREIACFYKFYLYICKVFNY